MVAVLNALPTKLPAEYAAGLDDASTALAAYRDAVNQFASAQTAAEQRHHAEGRAPVALQACAEAAIGQTRARAAQRGIMLALSGTGSNGPWEAELVTMALTNLLDNAIDFAPAGSTVQMELDGATVAVRDSGPGVPDYALPRLGERFFTTARPGGERSGSGLGLAIVKRVMALHGGQMVVRNTGPGLRVALEFPAS